ncbi:hypothetical protein C0992_003634 [Termitomyces sp. T32_za158]|nr:hypothetical protein C0992_003634 [Termitomyces sp. T32_za158]
MPSTSRDADRGEAVRPADPTGSMPPPARSQTMSLSSQSATPAGSQGQPVPGILSNADNVEIEDFNNASISKTVAVKDTPVPRPADLDIGPALKPLFFYSDEEVKELVDSETLCALFAPLPASLLREVVATRSRMRQEAETERQVQREKDKEVDASIRVKLLGSMEMTNPIERNLGEAKDIVIPTIYLLNIRNRYPPPLHFFTNHRIEQIHNAPQTIHTKVMRPFEMDGDLVEKVQLLDLAKMIPLWGNNDTFECLSPLHFLEASKNLLTCLKLLSRAPTEPDGADHPTSNSTNHAIEYGKHLEFFKQVEDFEDTYPLWYKFERDARLDIIMGNVVFNWPKYAARVDVILQSQRALMDSRRRWHPAPATKLARTTYDGDVGTARNPTHSWFFRDSAPACLLCGKTHWFPDHPGNIAMFDDGKPLFTRLAGNQLVIAKSTKGGAIKKVCGVFNLNRPCDNRHGSDALHICSLCGGDHPALARFSSCLRIANGQFHT